MSGPQKASAVEKMARSLHPPQRSVAIWGPFLAVTVIALIAILLVARHIQVHNELEKSTKSAEEVTVETILAKRDMKPHDLILPGDFQAYQVATLYARVNGYIQSWHKDIGAKVKEGELIAEIAAPDVDAQLRQAQANLEIANLNFTREKDLLIKKVVSQQDYDTALTSQEAKKANVQNLQAQQGFEKIVAPFNGTVTRRNIDVGDLVSAGSTSAGTLLFQLQQNDPLRIYVYVPQTNAPDIHDGMKAKVLVGEFPDRDFEGTVVRTAGALDPASRTLLTEVDIPNPDNALYAGMYGQVQFVLEEKTPPIVIPASAYMFRTAGPQIATIVNGNKIHWQSVKIGRDYGTKIELVSGIEENTQMVVNPTDDLREGEQVQVKQQAEKTEGKSESAENESAGGK